MLAGVHGYRSPQWYSQCMDEFSSLMHKAIYTFGYQDVSGVKAFIFLLDFCVNIHKLLRKSILQQPPWDGQSVSTWGMSNSKDEGALDEIDLREVDVQYSSNWQNYGNPIWHISEIGFRIWCINLSIDKEIKMLQPDNRYPNFAGNSWITRLNTQKASCEEKQYCIWWTSEQGDNNKGVSKENAEDG